MADTTINGPIKRCRRFTSKLIPDMTPMVGLGFMLVTFFIMAADFAKPTLIELAMPVRPKPTDEYSFACHGSVVTVIIGRNHQIHYFFGLNSFDFTPEVHTTNLGSEGLRQVLLNLQKESSCPVVLIKTTPDAKYKDMVDVLDEMKISNQKKYALVDLDAIDIELLKLKAL
ncbi:biopolymer transporter ExbD [Hymenobacter sp. BT188]|uniref:ExbD/TolR family protein n=1 Tax=Hymenobacter sp. BT188 TaxID=2763504 RepID=UPI0016517950|nr:biopolymer transporter ExbD [Hymenobacter sp. BT188]MBC6606895.1 biopolymer transporter ExbD [Hymenobacter sp. BT188]